MGIAKWGCTGLETAVNCVQMSLFLLLVWGFFGGAICRIAAVEVATDERLSMKQSRKFACRNYTGYVLSVLANLKPVAGIVSHKGGPLLITAGNSCPTNSGVTTQMIMSEEMALELGIEYLARIIGWGNGGVKQQIMGVGPSVATPKALKHAGLEPDQIDRIEFNEAFACQVVASLRDLGMSEEKVNVNGGSIGIGHPITATGNRLWMTVCRELKRSNKRYGMATQCIGNGEGMTTIFENPDAPK